MLKIQNITFILIFFILLSCTPKKLKHEGRKINDMLGRTVELPDSITGIIGISPGTVRLLAYLNAVPMLKGVEETETRGNRPYNMAYPEIATMPVIGPMFGGDAELIAGQKPDVIFSTYITTSEADELQTKTGIPVIALQYGDPGKKKELFYNSLSLIGNIIGKKQRTDSVIAYIEHVIEDLDARTKDIPENKKPEIYIGGVSNRGAHGITSTDPSYGPFPFINTKNIAQEYTTNDHSIYIDIEQLIKWDPDIIFLDCAGIEIIKKEIDDNKKTYNTLKAFRDSMIYLVQPYNSYTTNFATELVNSYYIGKTIYPEQFSDIRVENIAGSIYTTLLGSNVYKQMLYYYGGYSKYTSY
ncbi:MAG TPA: ABC transporter substrate-binding protein [Bacteroidales bacterium]|nr:ABC transporter substrate-binding protein [Bacteroidales bacterium]